jgi:hypothetical protein
MLVLYGGRDALIPQAWTERALAAACKMGDIVQIQLQPDKGHGEIDPTLAYGWIADRFSGAPALDSCASFTEAGTPPHGAGE